MSIQRIFHFDSFSNIISYNTVAVKDESSPRNYKIIYVYFI